MSQTDLGRTLGKQVRKDFSFIIRIFFILALSSQASSDHLFLLLLL